MVLRYGLTDAEPKTLEEIGRRLGLTRERVRQIEIDSLRRLSTLRELESVGARSRRGATTGRVETATAASASVAAHQFENGKSGSPVSRS